ncbi:MAG: SDR family NAD(P)-dependent oxidoreductase, partial [Alcaligenaceae bacterium]
MGGRAMFRDGVALVVGGSGGIGRAVCEGLFEAGCDVALTYRNNAQAADKIVQTGKRQGRQVSAATLDLTDREATHTLVEDVAKRFGGIHTLVLATGADISMTYCSQIDPLEWDRTIAGDLTGAFNITLATLPYLRQGGG